MPKLYINIKAFPCKSQLAEKIAAIILSSLLFLLITGDIFPSSRTGKAVAAPLKNFTYSEPLLIMQNGILTLLLDLGVDDEDTLRDLLKSGSTMELNIKVNIDRPRTIISDVTIANAEFSSILRYDPLTREFSIIMPGEVYPRFKDKKFSRLLTNSWKRMELPLVLQEKLFAGGMGEELNVKVDITLQYVKLPDWLDKTLVMWSRDVVHQETMQIKYTPNYPLRNSAE